MLLNHSLLPFYLIILEHSFCLYISLQQQTKLKRTEVKTVHTVSIKIPKKCLKDLTTFFTFLYGDSKNMKDIEFSRWLFKLPAKQHSQLSPSGSTFLPYLGLPSKSYHDNSISSIFSESPHQVDMKNVVKSPKHFFGYFNTLETHSVFRPSLMEQLNISQQHPLAFIYWGAPSLQRRQQLFKVWGGQVVIQVVMRRGAAAGGSFYSAKKLGEGQLPPPLPPSLTPL